MSRWFTRVRAAGLVALGVVIGGLLAQPGDVQEAEAKPKDCVKVGGICVDRYEASVWSEKNGGVQYGVASDDYPCADNGQDCKDKIFARSVPGVTPSSFITWFQAQAALANVGKRLPTSAEWQMAAQGTPDPGANSDAPGCRTAGESPVPTGSHTACVSDWGAFDMIGNLWEWVADWDEQALFCANWSASFGDDATCVGRGSGEASTGFPGALIRGGGFDCSFPGGCDESTGGTGAGVFAVYAGHQPSVSTDSIGFRGAR